MATIDTALAQLALHGGPPVLSGPRAPWPPSDERIRDALQEAWSDGSWGRYHGPHSARLAAALAEWHGTEFVTLCCSGTFAVELALRGLGIGPSDEVILAGYDFPGNFRAIEAASARPVLVDIEADGCLLDLEQLTAAIGPHTRAVIVSHLHGTLADMPRLMDWAQRSGVAVVEDACQVTGATIAGRAAGSWGDVGVLSFGGSKLLTAGRGGALLTANPEIHQRAKVFAHRGNDAFPLSELQAAVLVPQLEALAASNAARAANVERLRQRVASPAALTAICNRASDASPAYYKAAWRFEPQAAVVEIDEFVAALQAEGAPIDRGFRGFAGRSARRCRKVGALPHSRRAAQTTLLLHHPILLEPPERMDALAQAIGKVAAAYALANGI
ncbi:MAG: DegT/DnrJ/EryC1/StrS family aminotransferase [Pirellulales bacterium]